MPIRWCPLQGVGCMISYSKSSDFVRPLEDENPAFWSPAMPTPFTCGRKAKTEKIASVLKNVRLGVTGPEQTELADLIPHV